MSKLTLKTLLGITPLAAAVVFQLSNFQTSVQRRPASISFNAFQDSYQCPTGYTDYGEGCEKDTPSKQKTSGVNGKTFSAFQDSYKCPTGYTDYGEGCEKDTPSKQKTSGVDGKKFSAFQDSYKCPTGYTDYGEGCEKDTPSAKTEQLTASEENTTAPEENTTALEESREDKVACANGEDYNDLLKEIKLLKDKLATIDNAISELSKREYTPAPIKIVMPENHMQLPPYDFSQMYQPWWPTLYSAPQANTSMAPMSPMTPRIQTSYPDYYNPITINNYYYGNYARPAQNSALLPNYFSGNMNFGGLDQVKFNSPLSSAEQATPPGYFHF